MNKIVKCSKYKEVQPLKCACGYVFDILLGANSYIEILCPHCGVVTFVCNKNKDGLPKKGYLEVKEYNDHIIGKFTKKYFDISCITYGNETKFHLGEHSYAEFKCPHCGKYMAVKTTASVTKYLKPLYIDKRGFNQSRIC